MKNKKDKKKTIKIALIVCGVLILCLLLLISALRNSSKDEPKIVQISEEEHEEAVTDYIRDRGEQERMQVYFAEFIRCIEKGQYDRVYKKLHPEFKENFFKTEEAFATYAKKTYSSLMSVEYNDMQRQGTYYILTVTITNLERQETTINQMFIIHELGLNDYELSFQVK